MCVGGTIAIVALVVFWQISKRSTTLCSPDLGQYSLKGVRVHSQENDRNAVVNRVAAPDPSAQFKKLHVLPDGEDKLNALLAFFRTLSASDPELALRLAPQVSEPNLDYIYQRLFECAYPDLDVIKRVDFVMSSKEGSDRAKYLALQSLLGKVKIEQIDELRDRIQGSVLGNAQKIHLGACMIEKLIEDDPASVLAWCQSFIDPNIVDGLLTFASSKSPGDVLDYSSQLPAGSRRDDIINAAVSYVRTLTLEQAKSIAATSSRNSLRNAIECIFKCTFQFGLG